MSCATWCLYHQPRTMSHTVMTQSQLAATTASTVRHVQLGVCITSHEQCDLQWWHRANLQLQLRLQYVMCNLVFVSPPRTMWHTVMTQSQLAATTASTVRHVQLGVCITATNNDGQCSQIWDALFMLTWQTKTQFGQPTLWLQTQHSMTDNHHLQSHYKLTCTSHV